MVAVCMSRRESFRSMDDHAGLVAFVGGYRGEVAKSEVASTLAVLGKHGAEWPRCSSEQWIRELDRLVQSGELIEKSGMLSVPIEAAKQERQLNLF